MKRSNFTENMSKGPGGGVNIEQSAGSIDVIIFACHFNKNRAYKLIVISKNRLVVCLLSKYIF